MIGGMELPTTEPAPTTSRAPRRPPILRALAAATLILTPACDPAPTPGPQEQPTATATAAAFGPALETPSWRDTLESEVAALNADLEAGAPTVDVGIYLPSNFDPAFDLVTAERMLGSFAAAKEIYRPADVQLRLLFVRTGDVDPRILSLQSNETPGVPNGGYVNMYEHNRRHPSRPTPRAVAAFESIVEPAPDNHRTVYLVALQDVFYPFLEVAEGRNWRVRSVRTGGLSFPAYSYVNTLPSRLRGVITITNLQRPDRWRRTVAHEIGHKVMNVSHEYRDTDPGHEVYADGGLMLYGDGEEIPSGAAGRWHLERLHRSPFVYVEHDDGTREWNPDYVEGGHYYDPIYGEYVVHFDGTPPIGENW